MSINARHITDVSSSMGSVINFPITRAATTTSKIPAEINWNDIIGSTELEEQLRKTIESAIMDSYLKIKLSEPIQRDDPFDPIYISELKMDVISRGSIENLSTYAKIIDKSDSIEFHDDWESDDVPRS